MEVDYKKIQDRMTPKEQIRLWMVKDKKFIEVWPVDAVDLLKNGSAVWPEDATKELTEKAEKKELMALAKEKFGVDLDSRKSYKNLKIEFDQLEAAVDEPEAETNELNID